MAEPQSVRDIQVFLGFANFYRRFIRNFSRIAAPLTSMLRTTSDDDLGVQASGNEENQDATAGAGGAGGGGVGGSIKNLSTIAKSTKSKKSDLPKARVPGQFRNGFSYPRRQKAFTEAPILRHFDLECYIQIALNEALVK